MERRKMVRKVATKKRMKKRREAKEKGKEGETTWETKMNEKLERGRKTTAITGGKKEHRRKVESHEGGHDIKRWKDGRKVKSLGIRFSLTSNFISLA